MPVMNGWEFLTKAKRIERMRDVPIIIFSTSSHLRDKNIALDLGAVSYCVKPEDPDTLLNMLQMLIQHIGKSLEEFLASRTAARYFYSGTT
jgi:CheY-like chemotaxis protein